MTMWLKQNTAVTIKIGCFVDETDGKTAETALTISQADVRLSKNGGDMAQKNSATSCTHDEIGWYDCPLSTTDTNTLGDLLVMVHESGALPVWHKFMVVPAVVYDSLVGGSDTLTVDVTQWNGTAVASPATAGYPAVTIKSGTGTGEISLSGGKALLQDGAVTAAVVATGAIDADAIADNAIDAGAIATGAITSAKFAAGAINAAAIASDAVTDAKIATGAFTDTKFTSGAMNAFADALLKRDWTAVTGEAARSVLNALRFLRNKFTVVGTTLTVYKEDDATSAWTGTVTADDTADPITGNDPA